MSNYYETLEVPEDADQQVIKKAYRKLASIWHPDKHQNKETHSEAEEKFKKISEAYAILSEPEKRKEYDVSRKGGGIPFGFQTTGDPFEFFFSQQGPFSFHRMRTQQQEDRPLRGQSLELERVIPLKDALFGSEISFEFTTRSGCDTCSMRGATEFDTCDGCNGLGYTIQKQGPMVIQSSCMKCHGNSQSPKNTCSSCQGMKFLSDDRRIIVRIPPGIRHGNVLRLSGQGGRGFKGGPAGDVLIKVLIEYPDLSKLSEENLSTLRTLLD